MLPVLMIMIALLWVACTSQQPYPALVNAEASPEAQALLQFLHSIEGKYILSGHHNYHFESYRWSQGVKDITGDYPVVWGSDFSFRFMGEDPATERQKLIDHAIEYYNKGHIITLMWHSCFPTECDSCSKESIWLWQPGVSPETWDSLTTPGTELNDKWIEQVDHIAGYLKQLRDAHIPVLWRPYHEMNGIWFWWCNKRGDDGYAKLWRMMYDRFVNYHHLNNLIWVWNANAPRDIEGDEAYPYELFFPGLDYVDVLAADVYHYDYRQSHHDDLLKLAQGKPIALGEVGKMPMPEVIEQQPDWTWFMCWGPWLERANSPDSVKALYDSPRVLTLGEVQRDSKGQYSIHPK